MKPHYADDAVTLYAGDCLDVLRELPDASVDAVVTDPPYSLGFMGRTWDSHTGDNEDAAFGYWFSGFTDGEGCFRVQRHQRGTFTCTFSIKVRRDERGTLERIQRFFGGIGTIRDGEGSGNAKPQTMWAVQDKDGCKRLVQHFDKYRLQAKKRLDFEPWAEAVMEWHDMKRGNRWHGQSDWSRMAELKARVEGARQYVDPPWSGHGFQDWVRLWAAECHRILKPGGHLLAFGAPRQWHRLTAGIEDAGFEIRDSIAWLQGAGFPKSLDVSKAIDRAAGAEREVLSERHRPMLNSSMYGADAGGGFQENFTVTAPATDDARKWQGWGTALKPAFEPIVVARKPLSGTVAQTVLAHGTGALNIDASRVGTDSTIRTQRGTTQAWEGGAFSGDRENGSTAGRWPPNVVLDDAAADELATSQSEDVSRFFPTFDAAPSDLPLFPIESGTWSGEQSAEDGSTSAGKSTASKSDNSPTDGSGSKRTDPSPSASKSTTATTTHLTTSSTTSCVSPPNGTTTTTSDSASSTSGLTESSTDDASDATPTRLSTSSASDGRAHSRDTADPAPPHTVANGSDVIGMSSTPRGGTATREDSAANFPRWRYEPKAGSAERPRVAGEPGVGQGRVIEGASGKVRECRVCGSRTIRSGETEPACGHGDFAFIPTAAREEHVAHPTVKPLALMRWLVKLVTPPGGTVLEPFAGSGTTAEACVIEGFKCIAIERDESYLPLIVARLSKPIQVALDFDGEAS